MEAWLAGLPLSEYEKLSDSVQASEIALWSPYPGPQTQGYLTEADETFYGGSAGCGKSGLIAGLALTKHQRSLILRRESTQLRGIIDDLARTLGTRDGLNNQAGQWRIPKALAQKPDQLIEFGGVPNPGDEERHQGIPHDLLAFDEVTQIPEFVVDYLSTWNRSTFPGQRCRLLLCSNPPLPSNRKEATGGQWLLRRYAPWLDPQYRDPFGLGQAKPGELRWYVVLEGVEREWPDHYIFLYRPKIGPRKDVPELVVPMSRTFIPGLPTDNPSLPADYISKLQKLQEPMRSALLYGDFSVSLTDRPMQLYPTEWIRAATQRWRDLQAVIPHPMHNARQTSTGVDPARGGLSSTVAQPRYGSYFPEPEKIPAAIAKTGPDIGAEVLRLRRNGAPMVIDANGLGGSTFDYLSTTLGLSDIIGHVGSAGTSRRDKSGRYGFPNMRSYRMWKLREDLDPANGKRYAIPDDDKLIQAMLTVTWEERAEKIHVQSRESLIDDLGFSSDELDALTMANLVWEDDQVSDREERRQERLAEARGRASASGFSGRPPRWGDRELPRITHKW